MRRLLRLVFFGHSRGNTVRTCAAISDGLTRIHEAGVEGLDSVVDAVVVSAGLDSVFESPDFVSFDFVSLDFESSLDLESWSFDFESPPLLFLP